MSTTDEKVGGRVPLWIGISLDKRYELRFIEPLEDGRFSKETYKIEFFKSKPHAASRKKELQARGLHVEMFYTRRILN